MGNEETPVYNGTDIQGMDNTDKTTGTKGQEETKTEEEATKPPEHKTGNKTQNHPQRGDSFFICSLRVCRSADF